MLRKLEISDLSVIYLMLIVIELMLFYRGSLENTKFVDKNLDIH